MRGPPDPSYPMHNATQAAYSRLLLMRDHRAGRVDDEFYRTAMAKLDAVVKQRGEIRRQQFGGRRAKTVAVTLPKVNWE